MKKSYPNRMMTSEKTETKGTGLVCLSECNIHGFGTIEKDTEVTESTHPGLIAYLTRHGEHPNFKSKED